MKLSDFINSAFAENGARTNGAQGHTAQLYAFKNGGKNYDYSDDFEWHLSSKTGDGLKAIAIQYSKSINGVHWTVINEASLLKGAFSLLKPSGEYDFAIQVDGVEAISACDNDKTNESIDCVVIEGYNRTTKAGVIWGYITHLRAAQ